MDQKPYEKRTKQQLIKALADQKRRMTELEAATNDCISPMEKTFRSYQTQEILNKLLQIALQNISLEAMLRQFIDEITSLSWLALESKGAIFLTDRDPNVLEMKAHRALNASLLAKCARVPFGKCHGSTHRLMADRALGLCQIRQYAKGGLLCLEGC